MKSFNIIMVFFLILTFFVIIPASSRADDPPKKKIKKDTTKLDPQQIQKNNYILKEQIAAKDSFLLKLDSIKKAMKK